MKSEEILLLTKKRIKHSLNTGFGAEDLFQKLMIDRGNECIKSNLNDDLYKHIDFYVNGFGIDVKANRKLHSIWLEITNQSGYDGWLKGEADYIVMDIKEINAFCVFKRIDLLRFVENITETTENNKEYMKIYTRSKWGQKDRIVQCKFDDIKHLETQRIEYR